MESNEPVKMLHGDVRNVYMEFSAEDGMDTIIKKVCNEYKLSRNLQPLKVCITGPPASGKSTIGRQIFDLYRLNHFTKDDLIKTTLELLKETAGENTDGDIQGLDIDQEEEIREEARNILAEVDDFLGRTQSSSGHDPSVIESDHEAALSTAGGETGGSLLPQLIPKQATPPERDVTKLSDEVFIRLVRWRLLTNRCQNQGYILDGFPENLNQAKLLFAASDEILEASGEEAEDGRDVVDQRLVPDLVVVLEASDEFLNQRLQSVPAAQVQEKHKDKNFSKALQDFREMNSVYESTLLYYLDLQEILYSQIDITTGDGYLMQNITGKLMDMLGKPRNYGLTLEEEEALKNSQNFEKSKVEEVEKEDLEKTLLKIMIEKHIPKEVILMLMKYLMGGNKFAQESKMEVELASSKQVEVPGVIPFDVLKSAGNILVKQERYLEAMEKYEQAWTQCRSDDDKAMILNNRGVVYKKVGDDEKALEIFEEALTVKPEYIKVLIRRAMMFKKLKRFEDAMDDLAEAHALSIKHGQSVTGWQEVSEGILMDYSEEVIEQLASERTNEFPKDHYVKAFLRPFYCDPVSRFWRGIDVLPSSGDGDAQDPSKGFYAAVESMKEGRFSEIPDHCTVEIEKTDGKYRLEALLLRGSLNFLRGLKDEALADYLTIVNDPGVSNEIKSSAYLKAALVANLWLSIGMAAEYFAEAEKLWKDVYYHAAVCLVNKAEPIPGLALLEKGMELYPDPKVFPLLHVMGITIRLSYDACVTSNPQEAFGKLKQLEADGIFDGPECYELYGQTLLLLESTSDKAFSFFDKAVEASGGERMYSLKKVMAEYILNSDPKKTIEACMTFSEDPEVSNAAWYHIGEMKVMLGDPEGAFEAFDKSIELSSSVYDIRLRVLAKNTYKRATPNENESTTSYCGMYKLGNLGFLDSFIGETASDFRPNPKKVDQNNQKYTLDKRVLATLSGKRFFVEWLKSPRSRFLGAYQYHHHYVRILDHKLEVRCEHQENIDDHGFVKLVPWVAEEFQVSVAITEANILIRSRLDKYLGMKHYCVFRSNCECGCSYLFTGEFISSQVLDSSLTVGLSAVEKQIIGTLPFILRSTRIRYEMGLNELSLLNEDLIMMDGERYTVETILNAEGEIFQQENGTITDNEQLAFIRRFQNNFVLPNRTPFRRDIAELVSVRKKALIYGLTHRAMSLKAMTFIVTKGPVGDNLDRLVEWHQLFQKQLPFILVIKTRQNTDYKNLESKWINEISLLRLDRLVYYFCLLDDELNSFGEVLNAICAKFPKTVTSVDRIELFNLS